MDTTSTDIINLDTRALQAAELKRTGATYNQIAQTLGYSNPSGAFKAVQRARQYMMVSLGSLEDQRTEELDRLETLLNSIWNRGIAGELEAVDRILNISNAKRKLLGLDAPAKIDHRILLAEAQALANEIGVSVEELMIEAERMATARGLISGNGTPDGEEHEDAEVT